MNAKAGLFVPLLLAAFFFQGLSAVLSKSPTADEFSHHTASGYSHLVTRDFRMNPAEPPLSRLLSALPLYFIGVKAPLDDPSWESGNSPEFAQKFFYQPGFTQDRIIFWARLPILLAGVVFGYFVFAWASGLFGAFGGLAALALYVFCPDILAHSSLATSDICIALFFYLTLWRFWKYLEDPSRKNLVWSGVMAGLAFLSKFSAILIFPSLLLVTALTGSWKKTPPARIAAFLAVCFLTVWAGYFFEMKPLLKNTPDPAKKEAVYRKLGGEGLVRFASEVPVPLSTFSSAFASMMMTRAKGTNAYFMGEWSEGRKSWPLYYFTAFNIKNTVPSLIMILLSLLCLARLPLDRTTKAVLLAPIALFFIVTMRDRAQAGLRYFLPVYPLLFVLCGGFAAWAWEWKKGLRFAVMALLVWHALEAASIRPDYLSYFNELAGGPDGGYLYLRDSNIDWGQDLKGVAEWAKQNGSPEVVLVTLTAMDMRKAYGISWRTPAESEIREPGPYVYALGLHNFDNFAWTGSMAPTATIGHSMRIYDLRKK